MYRNEQLDKSVLIWKNMKSVLIHFELNFLGKTQDCSNLIPFIFTRPM